MRLIEGSYLHILILWARIDLPTSESLPSNCSRRSPWNSSDMSVQNKTYHKQPLMLRVGKYFHLVVIALVFMGLVSWLFQYLGSIDLVSKANWYRLWHWHHRCCPQECSPRGFLRALSPDSWEDGTSGGDQGDDISSRCLCTHNQAGVVRHQHWSTFRPSCGYFRTCDTESEGYKLVEGCGGKGPSISEWNKGDWWDIGFSSATKDFSHSTQRYQALGTAASDLCQRHGISWWRCMGHVGGEGVSTISKCYGFGHHREVLPHHRQVGVAAASIAEDYRRWSFTGSSLESQGRLRSLWYDNQYRW